MPVPLWPARISPCLAQWPQFCSAALVGWRDAGSVLEPYLQTKRDPADDVLSRQTARRLCIDCLPRLRGLLVGLRPGGDHHQGHAEQLRQRLQEVLRGLWAANIGSDPMHEEGGPKPLFGLSANPGSGWKSVASRRR